MQGVQIFLLTLHINIYSYMNTSNVLAVSSRSCSFKQEEIDAGKVQLLLQSALQTVYGQADNTCELYVTDNPSMLERLADTVPHGRGRCIKQAPLVIVIVADAAKDAYYDRRCADMEHALCAQAVALGLAACPVAVRGEYLDDGVESSYAVQGIFDYPESLKAYSIVAAGYAEKESLPYGEEDLDWDKIHII